MPIRDLSNAERRRAPWLLVSDTHSMRRERCGIVRERRYTTVRANLSICAVIHRRASTCPAWHFKHATDFCNSASWRLQEGFRTGKPPSQATVMRPSMLRVAKPMVRAMLARRNDYCCRWGVSTPDRMHLDNGLNVTYLRLHSASDVSSLCSLHAALQLISSTNR